MMKIKLLDKDVIEKIAAGEVVERPASVVKELVENSLDAGASRIEVTFKGSGTNFMEVSDNGIGMTAEELEFAFKRHATSKITNIEDLGKIMSLGFRGEALPSIAAVSKVTVMSKPQGPGGAHSFIIAADRESVLEAVARPAGTTVRVEELFYNLPARKKFLKSETTEKRNIIEVVESLSLARADVAFMLKSGNRKVVDFPGTSSENRFLQVMGKQLVDKIIKIEFVNPFVSISGFITNPGESYPTRRKMHVFVNGRPIYSSVVLHAITKGMESFIPPKRYPACSINIGVDPELVDVNVHPTKKEVKFVNQHGIHEILSKVIASEMSGTSPFQDVEIEGIGTVESEQERASRRRAGTGIPGTYQRSMKQTGSLEDIDLRKMTEFTFRGPSGGGSQEVPVMPAGKINVKFQLRNKYVIAEDDRGVLVIDQHTAWERINYERLKSQFANKGVLSQGDLIPEVIELESSQADVLSENIEKLESFGIHLENFGPNMFRILSVPAVAGKIKNSNEIKDMIENILSAFDEENAPASVEEFNDEIIKLIACRSSVKAGDRMSDEELQSMVKLLGDCMIPHRCPHGRPVIIRITEEELDRKFLR
jgi:DNA mismatch repair protein MutL